VQQRAAEVAYSVDERSSNNIMRLALASWCSGRAHRGATARAGIRRTGPLKGRFEALRHRASKGCHRPMRRSGRAGGLPIALGELLV
jgi:hypothetical protein